MLWLTRLLRRQQRRHSRWRRSGRRQRSIRGHHRRFRNRVQAGRADASGRRDERASRSLDNRWFRSLELYPERGQVVRARSRLVLRLGAPQGCLQGHHALAVRRQPTLLARAVPVLAVTLVPLQLDFEPVVPAAGAVGRRARDRRAGGPGLGAVVAVVGHSVPPLAHRHHIVAVGRGRGSLARRERTARRAVTMRLPPAPRLSRPAPRATPAATAFIAVHFCNYVADFREEKIRLATTICCNLRIISNTKFQVISDIF